MVFMLTACSVLSPQADGVAYQRLSARRAPPASTSFAPSQLAKTDIDRVADLYRQEIFLELRLLAEKLYRRNPRELAKGALAGSLDAETAARRLLDSAPGWQFAELAGKSSTDAVQLAFSDEYAGDRVLALVGGLAGMLDRAFHGQTAFYLLDDLDPQAFYNSARNIEIAVWRLSNSRQANGELFLLSNEARVQDQAANLSFEREFGKLIGHCDMFSSIIADKTNRTLVKVIQSLASAAFIPVSIK